MIAAPEVDLCITPADWVSRMYEEDCPALKGRCISWPAGVDTEYWRPESGRREPRRVLVFEKRTMPPEHVSNYLHVLRRRNFFISTVAYGSYTREQYLSALRQSSLMVGFASSESQGIAWAEAWSSDVPTLLWFQNHSTYLGRTLSCSTAPYLCESTGLFFSNLAEFENALWQWETSREAFHPRRWVLEEMSDEVCAKKFCQLAGIRLA